MHASHVDVGLDSRRTAHSPATQTIDFLWLELTNRCNLRCVHCCTESHPHSGDRDVLTTQAYERLMREAYNLGCRKLQFIGGEPQLNRDFHKLLVTANTIGFEFIEVFSNLTQLDDETVCYAAQNGICFATSVYSDEPAAHDAHHQGEIEPRSDDQKSQEADRQGHRDTGGHDRDRPGSGECEAH